MKNFLLYLIAAIFGKFITDNLPSLKIKKIVSVSKLIYKLAGYGFAPVFVYFLLRLNNAGIYKLSKKTALMFAISIFLLLILKNIKPIKTGRTNLLLNPADHSLPNNKF